MTEDREAEIIRSFVELSNELVADYDIVDMLTQLTANCASLLDVASAGLLLGEIGRGGDGPARDDQGAEGEGGRAASVPDPAGHRQAGAFEHRCSLLGRTTSPRSVTPAWPRR